jgi:protein-tyrosine-phosphatase
MLIHFICRGNILRSIIAETYLNSLQLPNIKAISSGTNVDFSIPQEREFFRNTQDLLKRHNILELAKTMPEQLTQERLCASDMVIIVNQRAYDEAKVLVTLPENTTIWSIVDIGEGDRVVANGNRQDLEELIYRELTSAVDVLVQSLRYNNSSALQIPQQKNQVI